MNAVLWGVLFGAFIGAGSMAIALIILLEWRK